MNNLFQKSDSFPQSGPPPSVDPLTEFLLPFLLPQPPPPPPPPQLTNNFHVISQKISSCSHCSCTIFILPSYSLHTQVMLILILINV